MKWLRPRYGQAPNKFHAATRSQHSYVTECAGRWPVSDVTDELAVDGTGSGAYATERCPACVEEVGAK